MNLLIRLTALLGLLALAQLSSCARGPELTSALSQPLDTTLLREAQQQRAHALLVGLRTGRLKFKGPITIQLGGTGNLATTTDATRAKAPVAAAPAATASATRLAGVPWQVYLIAGLFLVAGGFYLRGRLKVPGVP